jgi:hypothetical protein
MNKKLCHVTADSDPQQNWMEVEAISVFRAAVYYCGACAARPGRDSIIMVRVDGREHRVRESRVNDWANRRAEADAQRRLAMEKRRRAR